MAASMTMTAPASPGRTPRQWQGAVPNSVLAMLVFVAVEIMFFTGLISAFVILKAGMATWPPMGQPRLPVETTAVNTVVLLASGVVFFLAKRAFSTDATAGHIRRFFGMAMAMGAFFVAMQGYEWVRLIGHGLTLQSSTYGSFFYVIIGAHALHAIAALLALGYGYVRLANGQMTSSLFAALQILWYFVVGVWPILYVLVYLI